MVFIDTVSEERAAGEVETLYAQGRESFNYVPNMFKAFSQRPRVFGAWMKLLSSIRDEMDPRRYELVTLAAARALQSSYCMLAHGSILLKDFYDRNQLTALAKDFRSADLTAADIEMMDFAEKIVRDATSVSQSDIDRLRKHGFSDAEVFDIAASAAARCFFSKILDALGTEPDESYMNMEAELRQVLTVGRPISGTAVE